MQQEGQEQSDARCKGNCGMFRGIRVGYYLVVRRDDKAGQTEDKRGHTECVRPGLLILFSRQSAFWRFYRKGVASPESALRVSDKENIQTQ